MGKAIFDSWITYYSPAPPMPIVVWNIVLLQQGRELSSLSFEVQTISIFKVTIFIKKF